MKTIQISARACSREVCTECFSSKLIFVAELSRIVTGVQCQSSPEDGSVEVVCMCAVDGVQVAGSGELGCKLAPGHLQDLVGDVSLDHLDKVLHLMPVQLQLAKLHRAAGPFHQRWGKQM